MLDANVFLSDLRLVVRMLG